MNLLRSGIFLLFLLCLLAGQTAFAQRLKPVLRKANRAYFRDEHAQAIRLYRQVLAAKPQHVKANYNLGSLYLLQKQPDSALVYLQRVQQVEPGYRKDLPFLLGQAYQLSYRFEEAAAQYREMFGRTPRRDYEAHALYEKRLKESMAGQELMLKPAKVEIFNLGSAVNSPAPEHVPVLLQSDTVLLFTSRRSRPDQKKTRSGQPDEDVFSTTLSGKKWTEPVRLGKPVNTPEHDAAIAVSADGSTLYLYKDVNGGDIYMSTRKGYNDWSEPVRLPEPINSKAYEPSVFATEDGQFIFFSSDRDEGFGGLDLYLCLKQPDGTWSEAINLGPTINTEFDEDAPFVDSENNVLYFSSKGHNSMGGYDLFRSSIKESLWSQAENLGFPVNSPFDDVYLTLATDRNHGYFSSDRQGGFGDKDLYYAVFRQFTPADSIPVEPDIAVAMAEEEPELMADTAATVVAKVAPAREAQLTGKVVHAVTGMPLPATVTLTDNALQTTLATVRADSLTGSFSIPLAAGLNAGLSVEQPGFLFYSENLSIPAKGTPASLSRTIRLSPMKVGAKVVLKNIFFESGKAELSAQSLTELGRLYQLLTENEKLQIEISGHTDSKGSPALNKTLSEKRATAVKQYLVDKGIAPSRLKAVGYGLSKPVATNNTEEGRRQNRRTEFRILSN